MGKKLKVLAVVGTRPEAVKMAPVVRLLRRRPELETKLIATAQHRQLLDSMFKDLGMKADVDLDLMRRGQSFSGFLARALKELRGIFERERPGLVLAQGDTATTLAAALAALDCKIPFGHIEAGLRTHDKLRPFPEENIRVMADRLADLLFAPTALAKKNLLAENVQGAVFVTGNTGVDALLEAASRPHLFRESSLRRLPSTARLAVVTIHRRESFGEPMRDIFQGLLAAARRFPQLLWIYPVHPNPRVRAAVRVLRHRRIRLTRPLEYLDFVHLMKRAEFIVTDSGGIQEEAPSLGKPVLVMRDKTERMESLGRGGAILVGASGKGLLRALPGVLAGKVSPPACNPYGDGAAARRIVSAVVRWGGRRRKH
jgi:UDP-N-acetylglucosamine 2-epimerase (non-hydrolysing)